jgi:hypothetical protein
MQQTPNGKIALWVKTLGPESQRYIFRGYEAPPYSSEIDGQILQFQGVDGLFRQVRLGTNLGQHLNNGLFGNVEALIDNGSAWPQKGEILDMLELMHKAQLPLEEKERRFVQFITAVKAASDQLSEDNAMSAKNSSTAPGGIDLDQSMLNLQVRRDGKGMTFSGVADKAMQVSGFTPFIIRITPMESPLLSDSG